MMDEPDNEFDRHIELRADLAAFLDDALAEIGGAQPWVTLAKNPERYPDAFRLAIELFVESHPRYVDVRGGFAAPVFQGEEAARAVIAEHFRSGKKNNDGSVTVPFVRSTLREDREFALWERDSQIAGRVDALIAKGQTRENAIWDVTESREFGLSEAAIVKAYDRCKDRAREKRIEREEEEKFASMSRREWIRYRLSKLKRANKP